MLTPDESREALRRLFWKRRIANLAVLCKTLGTDAPISVFRRLALVGYLSSYNQNSRFYTLSDVPEFDSHGLWQHQGVLFSKHGTLNATLTHMVETADSGHTHGELEAIVRVRVHNMLFDLVKRGRIGRELLDGLFLYVSAQQERAAAQSDRRRQQSEAAARRPILSGQTLEIAVLLEVIHGALSIPAPTEVVKRLAAKDTRISRDDVEAIFHKHGLKKTPGSRSRSSRR